MQHASTVWPASPPSTLVDLLRLRAQQRPDRVAYTFLADGEREAGTLTWAALDAQARAVAAALRARVAPGERALLLHPPGLEFLPALFGCFYAGVIAVPAFPPRRGRHDARLEAIAVDCDARVALTTAAGLVHRDAAVAQTPALARLEWIASDAVDPALGARWEAPALDPGALAYLQYTSGSTSVPKGVMVSHGNLVYNLTDLDAPWDHDAESVFVTWLPVFHDMGLIYGLLQAVHRGFSVVQMSPEAFIQRPLRWLRAISRYRGTHSAAPNFAYDLCIRKTTPAQRAELDLSSWRNTLNAAEPVMPETMRAFCDAFAPCGFREATFSPGYGLAEATLKVSAEARANPPYVRRFSADALERHRVVEVDAAAPDARELVGCGPTLFETRVAIVDPETRRRLPPDRVGEIWVAGPSRALGYWNRPDESRETFAARIAGDDGAEEADPYLRTGDLGFVHDGQVFVTGRRKDLIIVRGSNHYPQDLEWTAQQSHPALRPGGGAAFAVPSGDGERVVVVHEVRDEGVDAATLRAAAEALREAVAREHEVPVDAVLLVPPGGVPKTSSGKKQRRACRDAFLEGTARELYAWRSPRVGGTAAVAPPQDTKVDALLTWLRGYAETRINSRVIDERRTMPPHVVMDLAARGLLAMQAPAALGGLGLGVRDMLRVVEQLGAIDQTIALFVALENVLGARPVLRFGSPEAQARVVGAMARGAALAAFALTEPGAGSNPRAIEGRALPDGEGRWRIHATKWWSGAASWSGFMHVFVHEVGRDGRARGVSAFTVPQETPGVRKGAEALTMGMRGIIQNAIHFEGALVDEGHRLGAPGRGMDIAEDAMGLGRLAIAAMSVGGMKRCAQLMLRYAARRRVATGLLLDNPVTERRLSEVVAATRALDALVARVAARYDGGAEPPPELHAVCKIAGPELFWEAADGLVQLLGGRGYVEPNLAPQILRDARVLRIFEGPTETLRMYLGARLWSGHDALHAFLATDLREPSLADALRAFTEELRAAAARAAPERAAGVVRLAQASLGEVAACAALLAAACESERCAPGAPHAVAWARERLAGAMAQARRDVAHHPARLGAAELTREIASFAAQIGDIEQRAAGEDHDLDPLLRRELPSPSAPVAPAVETSARETDAALSPAALAVRAWLVQWVARELRVEPSTIDGRRPLTEYGIDSVTAVQLAAELETWLETRLEPGIAWTAPTLDALAARVTTEAAAEAAQDIRGDLALPDDIRAEGAAPPREGPARRVLLTGATGFLGAHLLHDLLRATDAEIVCLVRADGVDAGRERLRGALAAYGLWRPEHAARITPVPGDLARPRLGLSDDAYRRACDDIDAVYHCGALVNFAYPYAALRPSNVLGAIEVLRLACAGRLKPLHYVSTFSLAAQLTLDPRRDTAREAALFDAPVHDDAALSRRFFDLGYVQSKWVADQLMLDAQARGLPVAVYRPASICGSRATGAWTRADWVVRMLEGCARMGAAPVQDAEISLVPVDWVSAAIVSISLRGNALGRGFNLGAAHRTPWARLLDRLEALGFAIERVDPAAWLHRLAHEARAQEHPLHPLVPMLTRRPADRIVLGFPPASRASVLLADATLADTGIACPPLDDALLDRYLRVIFRRADLAPAPASGAPWLSDAPPRTAPRAHRRQRYGAAFDGLFGERALSLATAADRARELAAARGLPETAPRAVALEEAHRIVAELVTTHAGSASVDRDRWADLLEGLARHVERTGRGPSWLARLTLALYRCADPDDDGGGLEAFEDAFLGLLLAEHDDDAAR